MFKISFTNGVNEKNKPPKMLVNNYNKICC